MAYLDRSNASIFPYLFTSECDNAEKAWKDLQRNYPELAKMQGQVETVTVDGKEIHRLVVQSEKGGFVGICNKLRQAGRGCILR